MAAYGRDLWGRIFNPAADRVDDLAICPGGGGLTEGAAFARSNPPTFIGPAAFGLAWPSSGTYALPGGLAPTALGLPRGTWPGGWLLRIDERARCCRIRRPGLALSGDRSLIRLSPARALTALGFFLHLWLRR